MGRFTPRQKSETDLTAGVLKKKKKKRCVFTSGRFIRTKSPILGENVQACITVGVRARMCVYVRACVYVCARALACVCMNACVCTVYIHAYVRVCGVRACVHVSQCVCLS